MPQRAVTAITLVAVLGAFAQWLAWRLRLPAIVILTGAGLLLGPGLGWLNPSEDFGGLLQPFISFAVSIILFEGGLRLKVHDLRESARGIRRLCTLGLIFGWVLGTAAAHMVGGLELPVAMVFGAIVVLTGPTVIMPLLRQARLNRRLASLFKWEGIVNDPIAALAAVLIVEATVTDGTAGDIAAQLGKAVLLGGGLGAGAGYGLSWMFRHGKVPEYQKAPMLVAVVFGVFAIANEIEHEAGLLAVTVMGFVVGNAGLASIAELTRFKDSISIILVSSVFLVVSADMDTDTLASLDGKAVGLLACVLFVVRPVSILLATVRAGMPWNERLLLAWIAPRGVVAAAVAGIFGPRLVEAGYADGALLVPLVFATILITVVVHGFSLAALARRLGLSAGRGDGLLIVGSTRWSAELARLLHSLGVPVLVADSSWDQLRRPRLAGVPCHYGEVLSESGEETLPLNELNIVLAATRNDAYNSLVSVHFGPEIGRDRVYQLAHPDLDAEDSRSVAPTARGRVLMSDEAHHDLLNQRMWEGWTFRTTTLSESYDWAAWQQDAEEDSELVLFVREKGALVLDALRFPAEPGNGDTLIAFVPPKDPARPRDSEK